MQITCASRTCSSLISCTLLPFADEVLQYTPKHIDLLFQQYLVHDGLPGSHALILRSYGKPKADFQEGIVVGYIGWHRFFVCFFFYKVLEVFPEIDLKFCNNNAKALSTTEASGNIGSGGLYNPGDKVAHIYCKASLVLVFSHIQQYQ